MHDHKEKAGSSIKAGVDVNAKDEDLKTALMHSAENCHKEVLDILLRAGSVVNYEDK